MEHPHRLLDQNFGVGIHPEVLAPKMLHLYDLMPRESGTRCPMAYHRPWSELLRKGESGASTVNTDKDKFRVDLDVQQFAPEEINVKVVDRFVLVEGKHDEKQDEHGWISRQFGRKYMIPEQCDIDQVTSKLSSDGVLTILVPRKQKSAPEGERVINIQQTGKPAVRDSKSAKSGEKKSEEEKPEESS